MHPDALEEITQDMEYMDRLVQEGKLPESVFPRLCCFGHEVLNGVSNDIQEFKCINCNTVWSKHHTEFKNSSMDCPGCGHDYSDTKVIFNITDDKKLTRWQCYDCKHIWTSNDGEICPSCRSCTHYSYWESDEVPDGKCTKCGTLKSDWLHPHSKRGIAKD